MTRPSGSTPSVLLVALLVGAVVLAPSVAASASVVGDDQTPVPPARAATPAHQRCPDHPPDADPDDGPDRKSPSGDESGCDQATCSKAESASGGAGPEPQFDEATGTGGPDRPGQPSEGGPAGRGPDGRTDDEAWSDHEGNEPDPWSDPCPAPPESPDRCDPAEGIDQGDGSEAEDDESPVTEDEAGTPPVPGQTSSTPIEVAPDPDGSGLASAEGVAVVDDERTALVAPDDSTSGSPDTATAETSPPESTAGAEAEGSAQELAGSVASGVAVGPPGARLEAVLRSARSPAAVSLAGATLVAVFLLLESRLARRRPRAALAELVGRRRRSFDR